MIFFTIEDLAVISYLQKKFHRLVIHEAKQESWVDHQFNLFSYLPPVKK